MRAIGGPNAPDLRMAVIADRPAVEAIVEAAYSPWIRRIGRKPGPMLDDYGALIREGCVHVVVVDTIVQGVIVLRPEQDAMVLDNIAVAPSAQGRGHGRTMLDFTEHAAHAAGLPAIRLYTNEAMTENIALYARLGFVETHRGIANGFRRVYMAKVLDRPSETDHGGSDADPAEA